MWGVAVGLDLVSVAQLMIARPLVAGTVAGVLVGDPAAGAVMGAVFELFALEVLPVGGVRYPDYGIGAVAAAALLAGTPGVLGFGLAVAVGLGVAALGQEGIHVVRRLNAADVRRWRDRLEAGDPSALRAVHLRGLARDAVRALLLTVVGLVAAGVVGRWVVIPVRGAVLLGMVGIGTGLAAALSGAMRLSQRGIGRRWMVLGFALGLAVVVWT